RPQRQRVHRRHVLAGRPRPVLQPPVRPGGDVRRHRPLAPPPRLSHRGPAPSARPVRFVTVPVPGPTRGRGGRPSGGGCPQWTRPCPEPPGPRPPASPAPGTAARPATRRRTPRRAARGRAPPRPSPG